MFSFGYAGLNTQLRENHVFSSRTARLETIKQKGIEYAIELTKLNLRDLLAILEWNEKHGIKFFRISSEFAPHISNPELIPGNKSGDFTVLAYDLTQFRGQFEQIGEFARHHGHRLTFHPGQFTTLGAVDAGVLLRSKRDLYFHTTALELMGLDLNSILVIHGGGVYESKKSSMLRWVKNFNSLPNNIKQRIVIENDEFSYNIDDVMMISNSVKRFPGCGILYKIPVVLDVFHYSCYEIALKIRQRQENEGRHFEPNRMKPQSDIAVLLPGIVKSWHGRRMKIHVSEQKDSDERAILGAHSDYVKKLPDYIVNAVISGVIPRPLDVMVEAKMKEKAALKLAKKYDL